MKDWNSDLRYTNTYFALADNEEEYRKLLRNSFRPMKVIKKFSCDQWEDEKQVFDIQSWHTCFETGYMDDDADDCDELPDPLEYNGDFGIKPNTEEYPVVLLIQPIYDDVVFTWYSIKNSCKVEMQS